MTATAETKTSRSTTHCATRPSTFIPREERGWQPYCPWCSGWDETDDSGWHHIPSTKRGETGNKERCPKLLRHWVPGFGYPAGGR